MLTDLWSDYSTETTKSIISFTCCSFSVAVEKLLDLSPMINNKQTQGHNKSYLNIWGIQ